MTWSWTPAGRAERRARRARRDADARALVYRGPASEPGCAEAVADVLTGIGLTTAFVGPRESLELTPETLRGRLIYAQPGGPDLDRSWRHMRDAAEAIRAHVRGGGGYLGFCLGGYLAGRDPGFGLLPGDTDQYIVTPAAEVRHDGDDVVSVQWRGQGRRRMYFQDGPYFALGKEARRAAHAVADRSVAATSVAEGGPAEILAHYNNGLPAAVLCRYGAGVVGAVGPHPEATRDWFTDVGLAVPRPLSLDLAAEFAQRAVAVVTAPVVT